MTRSIVRLTSFGAAMIVLMALGGCGNDSVQGVEAPQIPEMSESDQIQAVKIALPDTLIGHVWALDGATWDQKSTPRVIEVFSYACVHCYEFEPKISQWASSKPALDTEEGPKSWSSQVVLVPVAGGGIWDEFARAYFAMQEMNLHQLHDDLFEEVHGASGRSVIKSGSAREIAEFLGQRSGQDPQTILTMMQSDLIEGRVEAARQFSLQAKVAATPTLIIDGRRAVMLSSDVRETFSQMDQVLAEKK